MKVPFKGNDWGCGFIQPSWLSPRALEKGVDAARVILPASPRRPAPAPCAGDALRSLCPWRLSLALPLPSRLKVCPHLLALPLPSRLRVCPHSGLFLLARRTGDWLANQAPLLPLVIYSE